MAIQTIPITEIKNIADFGDKLSVLIDLLKDPKKLAGLTDELQDADAIIAKKSAISKMKAEAEALQSANDKRDLALKIQEAGISSRLENLSKSELEFKARQSDLAEAAKNIEKLEKKAQKAADLAEAIQADIDAKQLALNATLVSVKEKESILDAKILELNRRLEVLRAA